MADLNKYNDLNTQTRNGPGIHRAVHRGTDRAIQESNREAEGPAGLQKPRDDPPQKQSNDQKAKEPVTAPIPETNQLGGAFYLELLKSPSETFEELKLALEAMKDTDYSVSEQDWAAHGIVYSDDKWMMARSQIVQLESDERNGTFLELNKLEGDGFVFADLFKTNLAKALAGTVKDDQVMEAEVVEEDSDYRYLDFGADEDSAAILMNQFLNDLKPTEGLAKGYDQQKIFTAVSSLGHNVHENFNFINGFQEPIVEGVLEILRFEETNFLPTVYFGSKLISAFLEGDKLDSDLKKWKNVEMLVDALKKHCVGGEAIDNEMGTAGRQVTKSRQSMKILADAICKFAALCEKSELTPKMKDSFTKVFEQVSDEDLKSNLLKLL